MTSGDSPPSDDRIDDPIDDAIAGYLDLAHPRSFFLFAGAGSGKTRSLTKALRHIQLKHGEQLRHEGRRVGVVSYTNAACDEIKRRIDFDPAFEVATIHSFAWSLVAGFDNDIRRWLKRSLTDEIAELQEKEAKGRGGQASRDRLRKIESKSKRLARIGSINRFQYDPTGDNFGPAALGHAEVIKLTSDLLIERPLLATLLVNRFPILLIDESQDTHETVIRGLLSVQEHHKKRFALGLFGDTMQRIYAEGMAQPDQSIPDDWAKPAKRMNHRSASRIVRLANKMREMADAHDQLSRSDRPEGCVRFFAAPSTGVDKIHIENLAREHMAKASADSLWLTQEGSKVLTLEHHMAAIRLGFEPVFAPLDAVKHLQTGLREGSLPPVRLFSHRVLPLVEALQSGSTFRATAFLKKHSPALAASELEASRSPVKHLKNLQEASRTLLALSTQPTTTLRAILDVVSNYRLFEIPEALSPFTNEAVLSRERPDTDEEEREKIHQAWDGFLDSTLGHIALYRQYIDDKAPFGTHQGVKGLEFPRVMVVIDDDSARGFMFSYDKLFGLKAPTKTDRENEAKGKDTGIDRTRRLFYVTCTRAKDSLAIVAYTERPAVLIASVLQHGWFKESEVVELN